MNKILCLLCCLAASAHAQKWEGLALTPPMEWNSWNAFYYHVGEKVVRETAEAMVTNGMTDVDHDYMVTDDTWTLRRCDNTGKQWAECMLNTVPTDADPTVHGDRRWTVQGNQRIVTNVMFASCRSPLHPMVSSRCA